MQVQRQLCAPMCAIPTHGRNIVPAKLGFLPPLQACPVHKDLGFYPGFYRVLPPLKVCPVHKDLGFYRVLGF